MMILFYVVCNKNLFGQNTYVPLNGYTYHLMDRINISLDTISFHSSVKPYNRLVFDSLYYKPHRYEGHVYNFDEISPSSEGNKPLKESTNRIYLFENSTEIYFTPEESPINDGMLLNYFYKEPASFYAFTNEAFFIKVNPVLYTEFGFSSDTSELKFLNSRGIELRGGIDNKVGFYFYAADNQAKLPDYINDRIENSSSVLPGEGRVKPFKETGVDYLTARGYIGFNVTKHIAVQFGQDKIFIGDGIRSMIWSDNSKDFLFLKLNTNVWRINYQNIFAELANYKPININDGPIEKKYAAMHHLSVNITDDINIGLFESVVFDRIDSSGNNSGFELQYLNPIIFYRSVESGLGSPDNVLLGANWKWNFLHRFSFYGQFVLDEFIFDEFIKSSGWWGNKNALQLGLKYIDAFSINYLDLQYEFNTARPYTYAYEDNGSSYTHYSQAIAHPLGANFKENIFSAWYQITPKIVLQDNFISAVYGSDTSDSNWGSNIFSNYNTYEQEYDNTIAQGIKNNLLLNDFVISWQFWHNMFLEGRCIYRKNDAALNQFDIDELYFGIGIRINAVMSRNYY
ncbi:MAG: hypothetical protein H7Y00_02330 [Fimbriimonadaceae bacterium]|nr:hypothetical protein [Chitinophagales bacterium]